MKQKAYSYLRISTPAQEMGDGVRRQIEGSIKYAQEHGLELVETFQDLGVSGYKGKNSKDGKLGEVLRAINDGRIEPNSILLVESLDKLSREDTLNAFLQFTNIIKNNITIVTLIDKQVYNYEIIHTNPGLFYSSIGIMLRANEESQTKSKRLKAAWEKKRQSINEKILTEKSPSWLTINKDGSSFEIDQNKAESIRAIFKMCIDGIGVYSIARILNQSKIYPPIASSKRWNKSYVSKILHNRATIGEFQPNLVENGKRIPIGNVINDYYPPVIDKHTFILASNALRSRSINGKGRKGKKLSNLFNGILFCGKCGGHFVFENKGSRPKGGQYLRCHNTLLASSCKVPSWRYDEFETSFIRFVRELDLELIFNSDVNSSRQKLHIEIKDIEAEFEDNKNLIETFLRDIQSDSHGSQIYLSVMNKCRELSNRNDSLVLELEKKNFELNQLSISGNYKQKDSATNYLDKKLMGLSDDEIFMLRSKLRQYILSLVSSVTIFNKTDIMPWEISVKDDVSLCSSQYIKNLSERGLITDKAISQFIETDYGRRHMDKFERYFVVKFKTGASRIVWPAFNNTVFSSMPDLFRQKRS